MDLSFIWFPTTPFDVPVPFAINLARKASQPKVHHMCLHADHRSSVVLRGGLFSISTIVCTFLFLFPQHLDPHTILTELPCLPVLHLVRYIGGPHASDH